MVHVKSFSFAIWVILLFCGFSVESSRTRSSDELVLSRLVDPTTGKLDEDLAELLWKSCWQEVLGLKEANEDLAQCITQEGPKRNWKTNSKECTNLLFPVKQSLLDCIQKNWNSFHVFGGGISSGQHANGVTSLFPGCHIPRRNLVESIATTESPSPSPAPAPSPDLTLAPSRDPSTLNAPPLSQSPFFPLAGGPPTRDDDSSAVPAPAPPVETNSGNNEKRTIAITVAVTAVVTFAVAALFFFCCCRGRSGVQRTDEGPLLSVSLSDYSAASSNKTSGFGNSIKEEKLGSHSFGNVVAHDSSEYVKPESLCAPLEQTGGAGNLHGEAFGTLGKNTGLVPLPSGKIMSSPPLKPPPGRVDPFPPKPPTSLRPPNGQAGPPPPPLPPALPPRPKTSTNLTTSAPKPPPPPPPQASGFKPGPRPTASLGLAPPRPPVPTPIGFKVPQPPLASKPPFGATSADGDADVPKAKLKPFFWDKVLANPDHSMVWHQIKSGSFQFDEETIEALFGVGSGERKKNERKKDSTSQDAAAQHVQILNPKKSQNLSIMLRALNITSEEVCDAINEGNELPVEFLQNLLKMAPTTEEELKLRLYRGELFQLGPAERFLKALVDVPFAFKRLEALLFMCSLQEEVTNTKESFETLEVACKELRNSRLFLKLLEAVLKTGNRMNVGTFRGGAQAFKLDTLLKLSDVKGTDGKTTLLHFVVQEIVRSEGVRAARAAKQCPSFSGVSVKTEDLLEEVSTDTEEHYRSLGLQAVSHVSSELEHVKKAAAVDADNLRGTVAKLGRSLSQTRDFLNKEMTNLEEDNGFGETLKSFVQNAEVDIMSLLEEEKRIMALVKSTGDYFHGNAGTDEGLRLFAIVRDFLIILDRVCKEVGEAQKKAAKPPKKEASTASTQSSPADPRMHPSPDLHQRLFPSIAGRRIDYSSSSSDNET